jgi:ADP-ribosyl-[dinitrogen reductase] hydrolase
MAVCKPTNPPHLATGDAASGLAGSLVATVNMRSRAVGSVLGLALGDALGAPFESRRAADVPTPVPALELSWMSQPPGSTTDDTAMARNLSRSLVARGRLDPGDVLGRHVAWLATGPPDVGAYMRAVLLRVQAGERDAARAMWEERGPEASAGNGSVMYCAPLGVAYANRPDELHEAGPALSALTHWDERCRTAVTAISLAIAALVRGESPEASVQGALIAVEDLQGGEELEFLVDAIGTTRSVDGPDMGFCLFAAGLALQAALWQLGFEGALLRVVGSGGDTDTNAAVAGALVGAIAGRDGLPAQWLGRLVDRAAIEAEAVALSELAGVGA